MNRLILLFALIVTLTSCSDMDENSRTVLDFNFDWQFARGEISDAHKPDFDASDWRTIRLPHDWSVEEGFTQENTAGATAFLPGGIGYYRKSFTMPLNANGKLTWVEFDGVYNNATVWLNGHKLGFHPYGYTPFTFDLTPHLNYGTEKNVIVVKADRTAYVDCRWYPGSGIYRNVKLVTASKVHIPQWGTFVTIPLVDTNRAMVQIETHIKNSKSQEVKVRLLTSVVNAEGTEVAMGETLVDVPANKMVKLNPKIEITKPTLWDTKNPYQYKAISKVFADDKLTDVYETKFGIRTIKYDANKGFFLNGKATPFKGVNLHHDGGAVGAAVPDGVWIRRLKDLKEAGVNAIRTAHNPPSEAFLDLCDEMGFLVQDEVFDEFDNPKSKKHNFNQEKAEAVSKGYTEHFQEWQKVDAQVTVMRDRNHPSIVMWSIGNEIEWTYPRYGNATGYWGATKATPTTSYYSDAPPLSIEKMKSLFFAADSGKHALASTAKKLSKYIKEIDTSRPVTANLVIPSIGHFSGYTDALDIVGYSYRQAVYDYGHKNYPDKMLVGTENFPRYHEWKDAVERDFIPGIFIWTGIGYLGESRTWPSHGGSGGLLNHAGFKNPGFHHFKSFWNEEEPSLYLTTQTQEKSPYTTNSAGKVIEKQEGWWRSQKWGWQSVNEYWNYTLNTPIAVEAYTSCEQVELFLNNKSLGIQILSAEEDRILKWITPYEDGELKAVGKFKDGTTITEVIRTSSQFSALLVKADKVNLLADNYDVVHVEVQLLDEKGNSIRHEDKTVEFTIEGPVKRLGVDNGSGSVISGFNTNRIKTYRGKCLLILQAKDLEGEVVITASVDGISSSNISIKVLK